MDSVLGAVENPTRRKIIARLSEEPNYQLQLSKDLGLSQQLIAKHLGSMEDAGLVSAVLEDSPRGPQRKEYLLAKSVSVTIDISPSLFRARVFSFGSRPGDQDFEQAQLAGRMNDVMRYPDEATKIKPLTQVISEVDAKLKEMEERRAVLLYIRNMAMREAVRLSGVLSAADRRNVLHYLLKEQSDSIDDISRTLGLQQEVVGEIVDQMEEELASQ